MKKVLNATAKVLHSIVSFLTTGIILTALAVPILYLAHIRPYVVLSGSMEPAIPVHSVCFVNENIPFAQITPGEVISFRMEGGMLVTHRVSAVQDGRCITKGDANSIEDAVPVTADNYIGKTVAVIPGIGVVLILLHTTPGKICAGALILLLLVLSLIPQSKKDENPPERSEADETV